MKGIGILSISALCLVSLSAPRPATAQTAGSAARGTYRFLLEDELVKSVELDASTDAKGVTTGSLTFTDEAAIRDTDDPEDPRAGDPPPHFYMKADLDTLSVEKNRAVMGGTVRDSSHVTYIGKWVQLVVEDNGFNAKVPDRLTWSFCSRSQAGGWVPSDAERSSDNGAYLRWWATDAERSDDVGVPSTDLLGKGETSCRVYPLSNYSFASLLKWDGDLVVVQAPR
jgi:hypothetical protein